MRINKLSNYVGFKHSKQDDYISDVNKDISTLFLFTKGRTRFGDAVNNQNGENIAGEFIIYTSNGSANTEDTIPHTIGSVPVGYIVLKQDKASNVYLGTTTWTSSSIYLKQSGTTVATTLFLLK